MPRNPIPCPSNGCTGVIRVYSSGPMYMNTTSGMFHRESHVECSACGRKGKMLTTMDVALYLDAEEDVPAIASAPFPAAPAA